jgi:hypothetical protein
MGGECSIPCNECERQGEGKIERERESPSSHLYIIGIFTGTVYLVVAWSLLLCDDQWMEILS